MTPDQNQESKGADLITEQSSTQTTHVALVLLIEWWPKRVPELAKSHCVPRACRRPARVRRVALDWSGDLDEGREENARLGVQDGGQTLGSLRWLHFGYDVELDMGRRASA